MFGLENNAFLYYFCISWYVKTSDLHKDDLNNILLKIRELKKEASVFGVIFNHYL